MSSDPHQTTSNYPSLIVRSRYHLPPEVVADLRQRPVPWGFGPLSEAVYHRTYSRLIDDRQEAWADTVVRVVEGVMSIRQDWFENVIGRRWNKQHYDRLATRLAQLIFEMKLLPPGRGLWAMGTEYVYQRGSHALNNCAYVEVKDELARPARWLMDSLMCGVGVGFSVRHTSLKVREPHGEPTTYQVPDTKEGWAESVKRLIQSYEQGGRPVEFDYPLVRPAGAPIRGFGGVSAGHEPLEKLHNRLREYLTAHRRGEVSSLRLATDVMNAIGTCVVAGNVRRSAEIALGPLDEEFTHLKDFKRYPERQEIGWMSNNSVLLETREDFHRLPELAPMIADNGEPGVVNMINVRKYGRTSERREDAATGINPCSEIPLEDRELCNLVEVFPTRCREKELAEVFWFANLYAQTVTLLRSHSQETNEVVARNRRIGISVSGIADWIDTTSVAHVFDTLNTAYDGVRRANYELARETGVPESVRVTTVKPSGTVSLLAGASSGVHFPAGGHVLRRMRVASDSPVSQMLAAAGVPHEPDAYSDNTTTFEFPLHYGNGHTRPVREVSVYEQAAIVAMLQRCWADNAVSNTLTVQPGELGQVDRVLSLFAPQVKALSILPDLAGGAYEQMPVEAITKEEHDRRRAQIRQVNWNGLTGDGEDTRYCANETCELVVK